MKLPSNLMSVAAWKKCVFKIMKYQLQKMLSMFFNNYCVYFKFFSFNLHALDIK